MKRKFRPKVSVIVPVYKAEKFIERCAHSLFGQTLDSIEYIFIDDCSPDNSIALLNQVINKYPHRKPFVKIIRLAENSRQAKARTTGMKVAKGEYQIHCDPDDWVELDLYEKLYKHAKKSNSDITTCRYKRIFQDSSKIEGCCFSGTGKTCLKEFAFEFSLCSKLISSELIYKHKLFPYPGINCGEDLNVVFRALFFAKRVSYIEYEGYNYFCNMDSITHSNIKNNIEEYFKNNIKRLSDFVIETGECWLNDVLDKIKFSLKAPLIWRNSNISYEDAVYWCNLWPESNYIIKDLFPSYKGMIIKFFSRTPLAIWFLNRYLTFRY